MHVEGTVDASEFYRVCMKALDYLRHPLNFSHRLALLEELAEGRFKGMYFFELARRGPMEVENGTAPTPKESDLSNSIAPHHHVWEDVERREVDSGNALGILWVQRCVICKKLEGGATALGK